MTNNYQEKMSLYSETYRPQFHFTPKEKWLNDPNGMVYFEGEYHLFFQYHPHGTTWGPMHWGHAVSHDLLHWEELPIALYPDEHGAIFSGSCVVDWKNTTGFFEKGNGGLVAIYTNADTYPESDRPRQRQSLAYSHDNGRTWETYEGNPVLSDEDITDYRDPKVFWHVESERWVMVLATGQTITIYTSPNLIDWEFASEFGQNEGAHFGVWECPDLFPLMVDGNPDHMKWVMLVSIGDNPDFKEGSRTQYFVGEFDGKTFLNHHDADAILWLDHGRDNYAGVSWSDIPEENGRRIYLGWMNNWRYANQVPTETWRGAMTLPRELTLISTAGGVQLLQKPVSEIHSIRKESKVTKVIELTEEAYLVEGNHELMEVNLVVTLEAAKEFNLAIHHSSEEKTNIRYNRITHLLSVDRTQSGEIGFSESFPAISECPVALMDDTLSLQLFLDSSSLEVFAEGGRGALTNLIFPRGINHTLSLTAIGGGAQVEELSVTELSSIWEKGVCAYE
ncbi:glycoside hydrolase family 32 protein [Rossellomorea vietnamensis]|uniref:Glycoside hydrolase n=1 Tax=Rossellomorea vietnamensis TaxID=218284 RepID=A0A0P6VZ73_9BACI|nr:glycoside hydrolase family 32 protein [Rossellomorea vietnamensis]KPL58339.1 glycoside hydrolase [Rossellomorea vietnamensis]